MESQVQHTYEVPYSQRDSGEAIAKRCCEAQISAAATVTTVLALSMIFWWVFLSARKVLRRRPSASPQLASRLLNLVNGDTPTARRLIRNVNHSNPGRSVDWCLEKAILDLERDRR
jgi:hypothetical protein